MIMFLFVMGSSVIAAYNWRLVASSHGAEFVVSNEVMTHTIADSFCRVRGSKLAQFKSQHEYKSVADSNETKLWIQGRRACKDKSTFNCGTSDMNESFIYDDGTNVGVFAPWANHQPNFVNKSNIILFKDELHTVPPTAEFHALCRRVWTPLVTVDRVEYFRSVNSSLGYNEAKMFCLRNHGELAHFKLRNEFLNLVSVTGNASLWIDGTTQHVNKYGTPVGQYAIWDTNERSICQEDGLVLSDGKLKGVSSATYRGVALCERPNRNELNIIYSSENALFFASESSKFSFDEGSILCKKLGGELAQFKSAKEWKVVAEKVPNGQFWIAGTRRENYFVYPDGTRVGTYAKWAAGQPNNLEGSGDKVELINGELKVSGSGVGGKVLCRRSTIGISDQEWKEKSMTNLVHEKLNCAGKFDNVAKKAFCEHVEALLTSNTLEDQVNFSLLNKLGFTKYKLIKDLSPKCISRDDDRRLVKEERGNKTSGSAFRRTEVHDGTGRYDVGELEGNAREACRDWISKVDAKNGDNLCADLKEANKLSVEALGLTEYSNTVLGNFKLGTATTKVGLACGYAGAAGASMFSLDFGGGVSSALDAAAMLTDAVETYADMTYQYQQAAVNRMEKAAAELTGKAEEYDECSRPSTAELNCGIGQLSNKLDKYLPEINDKLDEVDDKLDKVDDKLDKMIVTNNVIKSVAIDIRNDLKIALKYLPLMNDKLDSLIVTNAIIEAIAIDISNDLRTALNEVRELMKISQRLMKYVQHDSEVHRAIQRLDEVYRSSLEVGSNDFYYWFASYTKDSSCKNLRELEFFAIRILNYLSRDIDDEKGSLLESCKPIIGLTRPELKGDYLAPGEVKSWLQEYNIEYNYLLTLAKFGYSLNILVHVNGFKKENKDFEELFNLLHPYEDYKLANTRYLESLNYTNSFPTWHDCLSCGDRGVNKYSWCKAHQISRTYCKNCHQHYHELNDDCIRNTCICQNGRVKEWCDKNGTTACDRCDAGYTLEGSGCRKARCRCSNGAPVSPTHCPSENVNRCSHCSRNYRLQNHHCVWAYTCTCRNGRPWWGTYCSSNREYCYRCNSGFVKQGSRCLKVLRSGDRIRLRPGHNCNPVSSFYFNYLYYIVAQGKRRGQYISFSDVVGLYHSASSRGWLGSGGIGHRCGLNRCLGSLSSKYGSGWHFAGNCKYERFQIHSSRYVNLRRYVYEYDLVSLYILGTGRGWLSNSGGCSLSTCPGYKRVTNTRCRCEAFDLAIAY